MTDNAGAPQNEVYAIYTGDINQDGVKRIFQGITTANANRVTHLHLLFQTWGGYVGDGVALYNLFRALPFDLTLYNAGAIHSIGVIAYLGAKGRKASTYASFMIHRTQSAPQRANADSLKAVTQSLVLDDARTEAILREHVKLPDDQWEVHKHGDLYLSGKQAVDCGLATAIGEFSPPAGTQIFQI